MARTVMSGWRDQVDANKRELDDANEALVAARKRRNEHIRDLVDVQGFEQRVVARAYSVSEPHVIRILAGDD